MTAALVVNLACSGREESRWEPEIGAAPPWTGGSAGAAGAGGSAGAGGATSSEAGVGGQVVVGPAPVSTAVSGELTAVFKSDGCGKPYAGISGRRPIKIETSGTKNADCAAMLNGEPRCGEWSALREFYVLMPAEYDREHAYPLVFEAPGCGGTGLDLYAFEQVVSSSVIRIGLSPGPTSLGHGTNPEQGCFDDMEGDDSIDWVFYENVYDYLNAELCFDRNRVLAGGNSSGGMLANELVCKYAGDPLRPMRGIFSHDGGLPTDSAHVPTCSSAPMVGLWVHRTNSSSLASSFEDAAIARAMSVNGCTIGDSYSNASFENFPIRGQPDDTCRRMAGCNPLHPLIVCPIPEYPRQGSHPEIVRSGVSALLDLFKKPPLLTE